MFSAMSNCNDWRIIPEYLPLLVWKHVSVPFGIDRPQVKSYRNKLKLTCTRSRGSWEEIDNKPISRRHIRLRGSWEYTHNKPTSWWQAPYWDERVMGGDSQETNQQTTDTILEHGNGRTMPWPQNFKTHF